MQATLEKPTVINDPLAGIDLKEDVFIKKPEEYTRKISPIRQYIEQQAKLLNIMRGVPYETAHEWVSKNIRKDGKFPFKNPTVDYISPDENGDRVRGTISLTQYLKETIVNEDVLTATFTTFTNHKKKLAYITEFVEEMIPLRKSFKKLQFQRMQEGDRVGAAFANNEQNNIKVSINSISGGTTIPSTAIYNKSVHPVLTSNCRMTSGYANANNEKLLGGNRHYFNAEITLNNLVALTTNIDEGLIETVLKKYHLYVPSGDELFDYIMQSTRLYWRWPEQEALIREFLNKCTRVQLASIAFNYDLNAMKKYNPVFTRHFIGSLSKRCEAIPDMSIEQASEIFNQSIGTIRSVAIQIYSNEVRGLKESQYVSTETVLGLAATIINIYRVFKEHEDFIHAFLRTDHLPSSLAQLPSALRKVVLMSDTDSSIFTTKHWTNWYYHQDQTPDTEEVDKDHVPVFAVMVMLSSATLKHLLATMSGNIGTGKERIFTIAMKNEYGMPVLVNMNRTKHYIYTIDFQEDNVYRELKTDKKGVNIKSSALPAEILDFADKLMERLYFFKRKDPIRLKQLLEEVAAKELEIIQSIKAGELKYYKRIQIKSEDSYKKPEPGKERETNYQQFVSWNRTFGKYYGEVNELPYTAVSVKLNINNKTDFKNWLDSMENRELAKDIEEDMKLRGKTELGTIAVPYEMFLMKPIPKEISDIADVRSIVGSLCLAYYIAFEAVGLFFINKNNTVLISDYYGKPMNIY